MNQQAGVFMHELGHNLGLGHGGPALLLGPLEYAEVDKNGKPIPVFDPRRFRYASIQSIVAENTVKKEQLNAEQQAALNAPQTKQRLEEEQRLVSGITCRLSSQRASWPGTSGLPVIASRPDVLPRS